MDPDKPLSNDTMNESIIDRYLKEMSLAEQIGQMSQIDVNMLLDDDGNGGKRLNHDLLERFIGEMAIGSILNTVAGTQWSARQYREAAIAINQVAEKYHRPPVIWGLDSVHGANYIKNAVLTPQPINIAATWNVTTSFVAGKIASRDTRASGIHWLFSPLIGLAIEPRWSRVYETFGEDPLLVGDMARAMIEGIQAPDDSAIPSRAASCAKHFVGYSTPRSGHDRSPSWIPTRHLYQYFVPPWQRALRKNGAKTVMESYTETDGSPIVSNGDKLNYLLRYRLNFTGVLVTDYEEIRNLHNWHHITASDQDAIIYALKEGSVDVSMIPWDADGFARSIVAGVQSQQLSPERIKESAARVLKLKNDLKMFDEIITIVEPNLDRVGTDVDTILPIVRESIVLAQNKNTLLPLNPNLPLKIHLTGPTANSLTMQSGGWTWQWQGSPSDDWFTYGETMLDALRTSKAWSLTYTCGVNILGNECDDPDENPADENIIDQVKHWVGLTPTTSIAKSVQGANAADVTIICIGEESYTEKPGDIRSLRLPNGQYDLIHAIKRNTDTKIIIVYFGGRPRLMTDVVDEVDSVILGFLPGPSAGSVIVDIITGRTNPSGRLPISYPSAEDGAGIPYWHEVTEQCTQDELGKVLPHFQYVPCPVQWPFGHGLSYTSFEYSNFSAVGGIDEDLNVQITVTNVGLRAGVETVMFFTFDESRHTTPEYKRLRAFEKVPLQPGESVTIKQRVSIEDLKFIGPHDDKHYISDPTMVSYLGVGAQIDCRVTENGFRNNNKSLCIQLKSQTQRKPYFPVCEIVCNIWDESNCKTEMSAESCMNLCIATGMFDSDNEIRGWNYVDCLEQVLVSIQESHNDKHAHCALMTMLCLDIFNFNEKFGIAKQSGSSQLSNTNFPVQQATSTYYIAFTSCLISSLLIIAFVKGTTVVKMKEMRKGNQIVDDEERFHDRGSIQFTPIVSARGLQVE